MKKIRKWVKYLKAFSQFEHVYEKRYQGTTTHLIGYHKVAAIVEDSNL